ncbi:sulfite exporter TauE/SafE family protein [Tepidamorphus sp. 3E244]|uniref:sulfite exporter TauE/SafE family protein n=1 Tax=Tepidamorphus sp. 3E244 TaxID=3385498 RepID=UPI0038FC1E3D
MLSDPWFFAVAIPAVILFGLSKAGLGAALAIPTVPLIALSVPPLQAAAIMLPIIIAMDATAILTFRREFDRRTLIYTLPAGLFGVGIGWMTAAYVTDAHVRLIIGVIAISFAMKYWLGGREVKEPKPHNAWKARFWATVAGFTSFVSHSGGVPFQMYTLPLRFEPRMLVATSVMFFSTINLSKLVPYIALGQITQQTLLASLVLSPLAPLTVLFGVRILNIIPKEPFYRLTYACVLIVGAKMLWDGIAALV